MRGTPLTSPIAPAGHPRLALPALLAFATPNLPLGAVVLALSVYLPNYYAAHFGSASRSWAWRS
jgi:hypothetical protein